MPVGPSLIRFPAGPPSGLGTLPSGVRITSAWRGVAWVPFPVRSTVFVSIVVNCASSPFGPQNTVWLSNRILTTYGSTALPLPETDVQSPSKITHSHFGLHPHLATMPPFY